MDPRAHMIDDLAAYLTYATLTCFPRLHNASPQCRLYSAIFTCCGAFSPRREANRSATKTGKPTPLWPTSFTALTVAPGMSDLLCSATVSGTTVSLSPVHISTSDPNSQACPSLSMKSQPFFVAQKSKIAPLRFN